MNQLQVLQNKAAKIILDMPMRSSATEALNELGWKSLEQIRLLHRLTMAFKYLHGHVDMELDVKLNRNVHNHDTRRRNDVRLPLNKRNWGQQRFIYHIFKDWNNLSMADSHGKILFSFGLNKAPVLDKVPMKVIKDALSCILPTLTEIINSSLYTYISFSVRLEGSRIDCIAEKWGSRGAQK